MAIFEDLRIRGQGHGLDLRDQGQSQGLQNVSSRPKTSSRTQPLVLTEVVAAPVVTVTVAAAATHLKKTTTKQT